jgi:hypothetical protein
VEVELGAAVGVGGVDPLAAAEEPVAGVAAGCWSVTSSHSVYLSFKLESTNLHRGIYMADLEIHCLLIRTERMPQCDSMSLLNSARAILPLVRRLCSSV